jgi:DNA-binding transcriptional ArsR family regulator
MAEEGLKLKDIRALKVLAFIHQHPGSTIHDVAEGLDLSYKTSQRYLRELRGAGRLIVKLEGVRNVQRFYVNGTDVEVYEAFSRLEKAVKSVIGGE